MSLQFAKQQKTSIKPRLPYAKSPPQRKLFHQPSRAKQSMADECNINNIMAKYKLSGMVDHVNQHQGSYGDFTGSQTYSESLQQIINAQEAFDSLPATVRKQFQNNPAAFLEFAENPENENEMRTMGLLPPLSPSKADKKEEDVQSPPNKEEAAQAAPTTS